MTHMPLGSYYWEQQCQKNSMKEEKGGWSSTKQTGLKCQVPDSVVFNQGPY